MCARGGGSSIRILAGGKKALRSGAQQSKGKKRMYNVVQPEGEKYYKIGDLASKLGTTQRALRFYEKKGLISSRRQGMHRLYTAQDRSRLEVILKAKQLGFTLAEIREMISDQANEPQFTPSLHIIDEQISMLSRRLTEIEAAIDQLEDIRVRLVG
jgi:DNA-binding transcriptional MerR regulator